MPRFTREWTSHSLTVEPLLEPSFPINRFIHVHTLTAWSSLYEDARLPFAEAKVQNVVPNEMRVLAYQNHGPNG